MKRRFVSKMLALTLAGVLVCSGSFAGAVPVQAETAESEDALIQATSLEETEDESTANSADEQRQPISGESEGSEDAGDLSEIESPEPSYGAADGSGQGIEAPAISDSSSNATGAEETGSKETGPEETGADSTGESSESEISEDEAEEKEED
ncbi:MAG: hypothetical protein Q4B85_10680, partial [Lachnospiraceae bacterium]|nr:hypothetical protein [Lachnospiraceae bacterium]